MTRTETHSYERWEGESAKAYFAFVIYRDLGPRRSLDEASRRYHSTASQEPNKAQSGTALPRKKRKSGHVRLWYEKFEWRRRAAAWDTENDQRLREAHAEARLEIAKRHAQHAKVMQFKAIERLAKLEPDALSPNDVLAFLIQASKLERQVLGEPETISEQWLTGKQGAKIKQVVVYVPENNRGRLAAPPSRVCTAECG